MARIIGKIQPLYRLRSELNSRNIYRFNSIAEINRFSKNYESEVRKSKRTAEEEIDQLIEHLEQTIIGNRETLRWKTEEISELYEAKILENELKIESHRNKKNKNVFNSLYHNSLIKILENENRKLPNVQVKKIAELAAKYKNIIQPDVDELIKYTLNKEGEILNRHHVNIKELERIRTNLQELNHIIAGAVGENLVVKEIKKLNDDFILINDFALDITPPIIYDKKPILSFQIDHLLICTKGIFNLETKNWSNKSIRNLDLRSPVEQIRRSSYALFKLLNDGLENNYIFLKPHHWGDRKIQIRNVIVMIKNKPRNNFKFVTIKKVDELNGYLNYLEPIYDHEEVENLYRYISNL